MMTRPFTLRAARPDVWISEPRRAQEALLVGVEDRDQRHLGQVEPFAQQVDADQHVELAAPQVAQDLDALERLDVGVQVAHLARRAPGSTASGPRPSAWSASSPARARCARPASRISCSRSSTWPLDRPHLDRRVDQAGRPDDLLDRRRRRAFVSSYGPGRRRDVDQPGPTRCSHSSKFSGRLSSADGRRKPYSTSISLRDRSPWYMPRTCGTVWWLSSTNDQRVVGQVVEQRRRRLARLRAR